MLRIRTIATILSAALLAVTIPVSAGEDSPAASGRFWYESGTGEDTYAMDLQIADAVAVRDELVGGLRVKVLLVGAPIDREAFTASLNETGVLLFTLSRLQIREHVTFDVCADEDGGNPEICGLHYSGPGLSASSSGFGVFGDVTESVAFDGGRVTARLKTPEPRKDGNTTYGFELEFDVPILEITKK